MIPLLASDNNCFKTFHVKSVFGRDIRAYKILLFRYLIEWDEIGIMLLIGLYYDIEWMELE